MGQSREVECAYGVELSTVLWKFNRETGVEMWILSFFGMCTFKCGLEYISNDSLGDVICTWNFFQFWVDFCFVVVFEIIILYLVDQHRLKNPGWRRLRRFRAVSSSSSFCVV